MRAERYQRAGLRAQAGFTLIEALIVLAILSVIALVALPSYSKHQQRVLNTQCISDITHLAQRLEKFKAITYAYPEYLAEMGEIPLDPWGNEYQYLNLLNVNDKSGKVKIDSDGNKIKGKKPRARKKKNLKPLNSDYDLFCTGADGDYAPNVSAGVSRDDIIRADDGAFIGLAGEY